MVEGLIIMLGVFITLLYTHTMPNMYYCSTCMLLYPHLMAKHCLKVGKNQDLRHETCPHGAVKVWWKDYYNHAGSVHHLVIHPYKHKQALLQHLHDAIPPLDGQTLPESRPEIEI